MSAVLNVVPPVLLCWPTISEVNVGAVAVEVEPSHQYSVPFGSVQQMATEGQSNRMVSEVEVHMKQRCVTKFLHVEKKMHIDIH